MKDLGSLRKKACHTIKQERKHSIRAFVEEVLMAHDDNFILGGVRAADVVQELKNVAVRIDTASSEEEKHIFEEEATKLREIIRNVTFSFYEDGKILSEEWYNDGVLSRDGGPAVVEYKHSGNAICTSWFKDGKVHNADGAAHVLYTERGNVWLSAWYEHGELHRVGGPARVYYENGTIREEEWYEHGKIHREGGPACVVYYENGTTREDGWYEHGV